MPKRLILLVAQPPEVDPRVEWAVSTAARDLDVTVVALGSQGDTRSGHDVPNCRTLRVARQPGLRALATFGLAVLAELRWHQRVVALLLGLPLAAAAAAYAAIRVLYRHLRRIEVLRRLAKGLRRRLPPGPPTRLVMFNASVAGHFAPVAHAYSRQIDALDSPPDAVLCCDLDTLLVGVRAKRRFGCRLIYDAHEFWPESDPDAAGWERWLFSSFERLLIRAADHVVTVNPHLAAHFEREYGLQHVMSVPNAAPLATLDEGRRDQRGFDPPQTDGKLKVLFQGGFAPRRGIEELLRAWRQLDPSDACLILRGPDNAFKSDCMRIARDLGLLDRSVFFPAPVATADLVAAARSADIGMIPYLPTLLNHRYCCPNKLSQYMHAGLMVVCSDLEYVRSVVTSSKAGISYDSARESGLVEALTVALGDADLRRRCRQNAIDYARSSFNWESVSAPLAAVFRSIAQAPAPGRRRTVLVLYYTRGVYPLRNTIRAHLYCWQRYSEHRTVYVNVAFGFPETLVGRLNVDAVVFDTTFLSMRWTPSTFQRFTSMCRSLIDMDCVKIVLPQDEFLNTGLLNEFIRDFGVTHLLTCADAADWPAIYPDVAPDKVSIRTILTGYVDPDTIERIDRKLARNPRRDIDIGYRAWRAEYWLGEHATHKVRVAQVVQEAARSAGFSTDISLRAQDVLNGDAWFDFLLRCRATVGVEGGATVLDAHGEIKQRVDAYLREHPGATFAQTRDACFPGEDGRISLMCISPRHLEACATRTCQFLIEGSYNGILRPWQHYIPLASDYSDVDAKLALLSDPTRIDEIVERAYREVARNDSLTYRAFVRDLDANIISATPLRPARNGALTRAIARCRLNAADRVNWTFIRFERWLLGSQGGLRRRIARRAYARMIKHWGEF